MIADFVTLCGTSSADIACGERVSAYVGPYGEHDLIVAGDGSAATVAFSAAWRNGEDGFDFYSDSDAEVSVWKPTATGHGESGISFYADHDVDLDVIGSVITDSAGPGVKVEADTGLLRLFFNRINYNARPWLSEVRVVSFLNWLT